MFIPFFFNEGVVLYCYCIPHIVLLQHLNNHFNLCVGVVTSQCLIYFVVEKQVVIFVISNALIELHFEYQ